MSVSAAEEATVQIRQLEHFEAVYRLRSFAQAAAEHFVTQSALSRSIRNLEDELGQSLFHRTTHMVEPTESAERLIRHALDVLASVSALSEEAAHLSGATTGTVRLGTGPYPAQPLVTRVVRQMSLAHSGVQVSVASGSAKDLLAALVKRELDFVVCDMSKFEDTPFVDDITIVPLPSEPLVVVGGAEHPFVSAEPTPEDLAACPWAIPTPAPHSLRGLVEPFAAIVSSGRWPFYRLESTSACLDVVKDQRTLTLVPSSLAREVCPANGLLFRYPGAALSTNDGIHMLRARTPSPAVSLAIESVSAVADEIASESREWAGTQQEWQGAVRKGPRRRARRANSSA